MKKATGATGAGFCDACFTGTYPVDVPASVSKGMLEVEGRSLVDDEPSTLLLLFDDKLVPTHQIKREDEDDDDDEY